MTYAYASQKIVSLFNRTLEHIDKIRNLVEPDVDWVDNSIWFEKMENEISIFRECARTVIEVYIELTEGELNWRALHELSRNYEERLITEVSTNKSELEF